MTTTDTLNLPVKTYALAQRLVREARAQETRIAARKAAYEAGEEVPQPDDEGEDEIKRLTWAEFGMLAYIELRGDPSVRELEEAANNGVEGMRHLLRQLRKRGVVTLTRHLNARKQITGGSYSIAEDIEDAA